MVSKKGKEEESSPALVVAASLALGGVGESIGSGGSLLCLWAVISRARAWCIAMLLKK